MVAHDNIAGKVTSPVNYGEDGKPDEPQINFPQEQEPKASAEALGSVRGGTTRPTEGNSGDVEQLDNDGKVTKLHPGAIVKELRENGPKAAAKLLKKGK